MAHGPFFWSRVTAVTGLDSIHRSRGLDSSLDSLLVIASYRPRSQEGLPSDGGQPTRSRPNHRAYGPPLLLLKGPGKLYKPTGPTRPKGVQVRSIACVEI